MHLDLIVEINTKLPTVFSGLWIRLIVQLGVVQIFSTEVSHCIQSSPVMTLLYLFFSLEQAVCMELCGGFMKCTNAQ